MIYHLLDCDLPEHPSTWFKIEFPEHRVVTFRPSAIRPVDAEGRIINIGLRPHHAEHVLPFRGSHANKNQANNNNNISSSSIEPTNDISSTNTASPSAMIIAPSSSSDLQSTAVSLPLLQEHLVQEATTAVVQHYHTATASNKRPLASSGRRLLSMTDPDTWVGQRVSLLSGKHAGHQGKVLSSGNGWVQILTDQGEEVAKRAYELQVIIQINSTIASNGSIVDNVVMHVKKKARFGRREQQQQQHNSQRIHTYDSSHGDAVSASSSRNGIHPSAEDTHFHNESAHNASRRGRPRAYSDSLMSASNCPAGGGLGFASNAGFQMCSSTAASMKSASEIFAAAASHKPSTRGPPLKNPAYIDAKRSYITKYVNRHLQKINGRPNLVDWKQQIDVGIVNCTVSERHTAQLFEDTHCEVCNLEKWSNAKFCWNESCPVSPVYFKLTGLSAPYLTLTQHTHPSSSSSSSLEAIHTDRRDDDVIRQSLPHLPPLEDEKERVEELPFRSLDLASNVVNDYLLQLPSQLIGRDCRRMDDESTGAYASVVWDDPHHRDEDDYLHRSKDDQTVLSLAPVRIAAAHAGDEIQCVLPSSLDMDPKATLQDPDRILSNDSLISMCTEGLEGEGSKQQPIYYSQYFCRTTEQRSDSFAETDSEVTSATVR